MNRDYKLNYDKILREANKRFDLEFKRGLKFDLSKFTILNKGKLFSNFSSRLISGFSNESFFLSLKNSYEKEAPGLETGNSPGVINHIEYPQIVILIKSNLELPNLIIRPFYFNEKIVNVFLKFDIKLRDRKNFNRKFVLESKSEIDILQNCLSEEFTSKIENYEGFSMEILDSNILLKFEREITIEKIIALFDVANLLDKKA